MSDERNITMNSLFYQILFPLLSAHLLGDFIFQTDKDVKNKRNIYVFMKHISLVTILSYLFAGIWDNMIIPIIIFLSHTIIDTIKRTIRKDSLGIFIVDQTTHIVIAILLAYYIQSRVNVIVSDTFWYNTFGVAYSRTLVLLISIVLVTKFSGIIINYIIKPFQSKIIPNGSNEKDSVSTGRLIGYLERLIILVLFLVDLPATVGFLITAKSILRYGEIKNEKDKAMIEYVLIGTLLSFTAGIIIAAITKKVFASLV